MFLFKAKGILDFTPQDMTKKHINQSSWKRVAIIKTNCDISEYYAWYLKKRFNLILNKPLRGTHITFISDRLDKKIFQEASDIFNKKEITFYYEPIPKSNGLHWWLRAFSTEAEDIREALGLDRNPYFGMHLTIGIANEKNIDHSKYILECCKKFQILPTDTRMELDKYKIIE